MALVNAKLLATVFDLGIRRIHQLVEEGMPKRTRGRYDLLECVRWYIKYLHAVIEKKGVPVAGGGFAGEHGERVRLIRADADMREMLLAKERGLLVAVHDAEREVLDLVLMTKARILSIPGRLASEVTGQDSRIMVQAIIEKHLKEALSQLAKYDKSNVARAESPVGALVSSNANP
jgi:phage terminase Nu1 subunit (DNA packaging protein)